MAGIAGIVVTSEGIDSDLLLQRMSAAIKHRGFEAFHTMRQKDSICQVVGPHSVQGPNDDIFIIDRNKHLFPKEFKDDDDLSDLFGTIIVILDNTGVSLLRSLDGTRALYYETIDGGFVFATEKKSLWSIELSSVQTLKPGHRITKPWIGEPSTHIFSSRKQIPSWDISREQTLVLLKSALLSAFEKLNTDTSCAVLFSGGVDSSLVAIQSAKRCDNTVLFTSSSENAHDESAAAEAAALLDLPLNSLRVNTQVIWDILPEVIYTIETSNQMDIEIAIPFYLASKKAAEEGFTTVISGQGPDELFAGYAKHVETFVERGPDVLKKQLWNEVSITHETNIERDERAIAAHGVESFFPYLDSVFVQTALSIPTQWKVNPNRKPERKVIFRELAQLMGVPNEIAFTPKSATQYSSGSSKILLEAAIEHVDELGVMSRKKASLRVQDVLNEIANAIHMPNIQKIERSLHGDFEPVMKFLERREHLSSRNFR